MKNLKSGILFLLLFNLSFTVQADEIFRNFTLGRFDSVLNVNYFKSTANFGSNGSQQSLPSGYSFQIIDTAISARYVLMDDLGLHAGLNIGSSEATDSVATRRNSTLNDVTLGADYLFYQNRNFSLYADLTYKHAVEKVTTDTDSVLNSDGASEVQARVTALFDVSYMQPYISGGVNYRTEGLSTLLTYTLGTQTSFGKFVLGAALNGFTSVVDDSKTNSPAEREIITNRVDATSKKFYSINPNLLDADLYLKFTLTANLAIQANGGYTLTGSNMAAGYHFGAGVAWGFGGDHYENYSRPTHRVTPPTTPPAAQAPQKPAAAPKTPSQKFQEDTSDGVNQDYFKPVKPSQDSYYDKVQDVPPAADEGDDFQVSTKKTAPPADNNEYQIKLKKTKKK